MTTTVRPKCAHCEHTMRLLTFPDGTYRCHRHLSDDEHALVAELNERGRRVGLKSDPEHVHGRFWPYGPNIDVGARQRMLDWAEGHGLRIAHPSRQPCLHWLRSGRSGYCGCPNGQPDWMDHVTGWLLNRKPACVVAHPYPPCHADELAALHAEPQLRVDHQPAGWYGHGTEQITVWRVDTQRSLR